MSTLFTKILGYSRKVLQYSASPELQVRGKKRLNIPRLRHPTWFVRKERVLHEDEVSAENRKFVQDVVSDKYGPTGLITSVSPNECPLRNEPVQPVEWTPGLRRTGVIAKKIGQYPLWLKDGTKIHTTLLQVIDNHVVKYVTPEDYTETRKRVIAVRGKKKGCLLVGAESVDPSLYTREYCGIFEKSGMMPKKFLARFFISPEAAMTPGTPLNAVHFKIGEYVDVRAKTVDRGFQGVVVRWGFKGGRASHGNTKTHRRPGNIGGGGEKSRVWPGTKMPGHMGNQWRILKGLRIWRINTKYNVLWVNGYNIPGPTNSYCYIYDTILPTRRPKTPPHFPTFLGNVQESFAEEIYDDQIHKFDDPTVTFEE